MAHQKHIAFLLILFSYIAVYADGGEKFKKQVDASRATTAPNIDGHLNEFIWQKAIAANDFIQHSPYNGNPASQQTEVRFCYDNAALYIGAIMYDLSPDSIFTELSERDNVNMSDHITIYLDPFNDAQYAFVFQLTAAGVQIDKKYTEGKETDASWDAVWKSAVNITQQGWVAEIKIPWSALRFPNNPEQIWGLQIFRNIARYRESNSWTLVDRKVPGIIHQSGKLTGITDIKPSLRLSFMPYTSSYTISDAGSNKWNHTWKAGMDLKYGINESFTLDMILIPDFGQVQSDDKVYNFSPYELYYGEKRPFFTEGVELFGREGVFYSRRIGSEPVGKQDVESQLTEREKIIENPAETQLINATKISGKTKKGTGLGVFNAMTSNAYARIRDTVSGEERSLRTQAFTNYNMLVVDQALKNNSFVSAYNTNVYRPEEHYGANVSGVSFELNDKNIIYTVNGAVNVSQKYNKEQHPDLGHKYYLNAGKTGGKFQFSAYHVVESDHYDPNDMGYLQTNNELSHGLDLRYNIFEPVGQIISSHTKLYIRHSNLYVPRVYRSFSMGLNSWTTMSNYLSVSVNIHVNPVETHNYDEAREEGQVFIQSPFNQFSVMFSPDYRKRFIVDLRMGISAHRDYNNHKHWMNIEPRFRLNDKITLEHEFRFSHEDNAVGYVNALTDTLDDIEIIFGKRDIDIFENRLKLDYIFNNKSSLSFRLRHYWLTALYDDFFRLMDNGSLEDSDYNENNNLNYNAFTIDMAYSWHFAPGSELSLVWKNSMYDEQDIVDNNFAENFTQTIQSASTNSLSFKVLYYLDYQYLRKSI